MADEVKNISRVKLVDGFTYEIKDADARATLELLFGGDLIFDGGTSVSDGSATTTT